MNLYEIADKFGTWCNSTAGWSVTALLIGAIIVALIWMKRHPEDFFRWDEDEEQVIEIEEIDHGTR